jgi:hypothetical protein
MPDHDPTYNLGIVGRLELGALPGRRRISEHGANCYSPNCGAKADTQMSDLILRSDLQPGLGLHS